MTDEEPSLMPHRGTETDLGFRWIRISGFQCLNISGNRASTSLVGWAWTQLRESAGSRPSLRD
jgi:hypothetical protein